MKVTRAVPGGANGSRTNSNLDDVSSGKDESLDHIASHDISGLRSNRFEKIIIFVTLSDLNGLIIDLILLLGSLNDQS